MIDSRTETLVSLADVPTYLPDRRGGKRPHISCIYRWAQRGVKGVKLEVLQCGGTKVTSHEALQRFFERLSAAAGDGAEVAFTRSVKQRQLAAEKATRELAAAGW